MRIEKKFLSLGLSYIRVLALPPFHFYYTRMPNVPVLAFKRWKVSHFLSHAGREPDKWREEEGGTSLFV